MADVIICLGASPVEYKGQAQMDLRARRAAELFQAGKAKNIIVTGARTSGAQSEAHYLQSVLRSLGIPNNAITREEKATTTVGNAKYSYDIMRRKGWKSAFVVTSAFHIPRCRWLFRQIMLDFKVDFEPSQGISIIHSLKGYWRNWTGLQRMKMTGIDMKRL